MSEEPIKGRFGHIGLPLIGVFIAEAARYLIPALPGIAIFFYALWVHASSNFTLGIIIGIIIGVNFTWIIYRAILRGKEKKGKEFKIRDLSLLLRIENKGKKVTYKRVANLVCIRRYGVRDYRFRLCWSGEDDVKTKLKQLPPENKKNVKYILSYKNKHDYWECFETKFDHHLSWRQQQEIAVVATLKEPKRIYNKMLSYTTGEPFIRSIIHRRLSMTVHFQERTPDPQNIRAFEYPYYEYIFTSEDKPIKKHRVNFDVVNREIRWNIRPKFLHYYVLRWE